MVRTRVLKTAIAVSVALPAVAVILYSKGGPLHLLFIIWAAGAAAGWVILDRKEQAQQSQRTAKALELTAIRTLNYHRHDWMNDLQILYGYVRMNKPDRIVQCVDRIREKMLMESRISKLGSPSLVLFLHAFRTTSSALQLTVQLDEGIDAAELSFDDERIPSGLMALLDSYRTGIQSGMGELPCLTLEMTIEEQKLRITFLLQGEFGSGEQLFTQFNAKLRHTPFQPISMDPSMRLVVVQADLRN
ncbi:histidine kinase [Paenibacillaceae bacterium]|nr:histidine kinase [Paenibacillaceae bacterium]